MTKQTQTQQLHEASGQDSYLAKVEAEYLAKEKQKLDEFLAAGGSLTPKRHHKKAEPKNPCGCGCGRLVVNRFAPGHDSKLKSRLRKQLKAEYLAKQQAEQAKAVEAEAQAV